MRGKNQPTAISVSAEGGELGWKRRPHHHRRLSDAVDAVDVAVERVAVKRVAAEWVAVEWVAVAGAGLLEVLPQLGQLLLDFAQLRHDHLLWILFVLFELRCKVYVRRHHCDHIGVDGEDSQEQIEHFLLVGRQYKSVVEQVLNGPRAARHLRRYGWIA